MTTRTVLAIEEAMPELSGRERSEKIERAVTLVML
jgi:hypothetical protein